jgi:hypothetical protein
LSRVGVADISPNEWSPNGDLYFHWNVDIDQRRLWRDPCFYVLVRVIYAGNGSGGASQADTLTLDLFSAFQSTFGTGNFAPESFNVSSPFSTASSGGAFSFDYSSTAAKVPSRTLTSFRRPRSARSKPDSGSPARRLVLCFPRRKAAGSAVRWCGSSAASTPGKPDCRRACNTRTA